MHQQARKRHIGTGTSAPGPAPVSASAPACYQRASTTASTTASRALFSSASTPAASTTPLTPAPIPPANTAATTTSTCQYQHRYRHCSTSAPAPAPASALRQAPTPAPVLSPVQRRRWPHPLSTQGLTGHGGSRQGRGSPPQHGNPGGVPMLAAGCGRGAVLPQWHAAGTSISTVYAPSPTPARRRWAVHLHCSNSFPLSTQAA